MYCKHYLNRFLLGVSFACVLLSSCSRQNYYAPSLKEAQPMTMPVAEPYTDIQIFKKSYKDLAYSDSLSALAHKALQEVLDGENPWNVKRVDSLDVLKYAASVKRWAEECLSTDDIADVDVPADILDYMKASDEPYLMFIIQKGIEHDKNSRITVLESLKNHDTPVLSFQALVADAVTGKTAYYNNYYWHDPYSGSLSHSMNPSSFSGVETGMFGLLDNYPDKKSNSLFRIQERPTDWNIIHVGLGAMYSGAMPGYMSRGWEPAWTTSFNFLPWQLADSPFNVGIGASSLISLGSITDSKGDKYYTGSYESIGPEVAYNQIFGNRHVLTLMLGLHYSQGGSWQLTPDMDANRFRSRGLAAQASMSYHYRLSTYRGLGITLNAQSLLYDTPLSNPNSPIDNNFISISYLLTSF